MASETTLFCAVIIAAPIRFLRSVAVSPTPPLASVGICLSAIWFLRRVAEPIRLPMPLPILSKIAI